MKSETVAATASQWRYMRLTGFRGGRTLLHHGRHLKIMSNQKILLRQSMHIYLKYNCDRFHLKQGALGFSWRALPQQEQDG